MFLLWPADFSFSQLPWFHPYVEVRERFERHVNPSFNAPKGLNRSDLFERYRLGANLDLGGKFKGTAEYQYINDVFWTRKANNMVQNSDMSLGYVQYNEGNSTISAGREKFTLGEMRLIGPSEWTNLSRSFDMVRDHAGQWDVWAGTLGMANRDTRTVRVADATHVDSTWGTTSIILKHDVAALGSIDVQTLNHFAKHKFGNTTVDAEGALQTGTTNLKDQRAWAYHARVTEDIGAHTTFSLETDAASGGGNANTSRTFDNLYASNHGLYGLADTTGWKNMNYLAARVENKTIPAITLRGCAQTFSLRDASDAWYGYAGPANTRAGGIFQDPTGKSGRKLGDEYDFEAIWDLKKSGNIMVGIAFFKPGDFVQNLTGHSNQMVFGYVQYQIHF